MGYLVCFMLRNNLLGQQGTKILNEDGFWQIKGKTLLVNLNVKNKSCDIDLQNIIDNIPLPFDQLIEDNNIDSLEMVGNSYKDIPNDQTPSQAPDVTQKNPWKSNTADYKVDSH